MRRTRSRLLAVPLAACALLGGLLVAGTADAVLNVPAQTVTFSPAGPFLGGETVTVTATGFTPTAPIVIAVCPHFRAITGPGDCGHSAANYAELSTASATGTATATLTVPVGSLHNATRPVVSCDPTHRCDFVATNIGKATEQARKAIPYDLSIPSIAMSPKGPYRDGTKVSVVATGFSPFAPVAIGQCADRPILGPGDCGHSAADALKLVTTDGQGVALANLTVAYGPLGNVSPPAVRCTATAICIIDAVNIGDATEELALPLRLSNKLVKPKVSISLSKSTIERGERVTVKGKVSPNAEGERVLLQRKTRSGWVTKHYVTMGYTSTYTITWKPGAGTAEWRVKIDAKPWHPASTSTVRTLRVH